MHVGIFLPNWIGDVVMATPAVRAVRKHFGPEARLVGVMRPYVAEVLAGSTVFDDVVVYAKRPGPEECSAGEAVGEATSIVLVADGTRRQGNR